MLMYLTIIDSKEGQQKFEFIYNRYKKLMFYIANKILGDTRDSEDTVHDAFLKIIEIIDDIKDVESPQTRSLIVTITENTCRKDESGRKLDKAAMLVCSKALGHNRIDVVANNYIRDL